ncbi:hypothetical protein RYR54_000756 [Aeromonas sobria]|nr:hypothetical protein [Aeromonas sobria]
MPRHHVLLGLLALLPLAANAAYRFDVPDYLARLPEQTYQIVEHNFSTLYQQTDFTPQITNSYFNDSNLYKFVGVPLVITAQAGFQLEVFGQVYNRASQAYTHLSQDMSLYRVMRVDLMGNPNDQLAIGFGLGVPLSPQLTLKAIASGSDIPGYGSAKYAVGFEWHY